MLKTVIGLIYMFGAIICVWPIREFMRSEFPGDTEPMDLAFMGFMSCFFAIFWPILFAMGIALKLSRFVWGKILDDKKEPQYIDLIDPKKFIQKETEDGN